MGRLYVLILFICLVSSEITAQSYNKFLDKLCDYQDNVRLEENWLEIGSFETLIQIRLI